MSGFELIGGPRAATVTKSNSYGAKAGGRRKTSGAIILALALAIGGWVAGAALTGAQEAPRPTLGPFSYFPS